MILAERIEFSPHLASFYSEMIRLSSQVCRDRHALTLSEYELLMALMESNGPLLISELSDFLVLQVGTVWQMTSSLAKRGLIEGRSSKEDGRCQLCSLTEEGNRLASRCCEDLHGYLNSICQRLLPDSEFFGCINSSIASSLDVLRGHEAACSDKMVREVRFKAEFTILSRVLTERWRLCVADACGLSLTQFRMLHVLDEAQAVRVQDLADSLFIPRSQASTCKNVLISGGFAQQQSNPEDARSVIVSRTSKGSALVNQILPLLNEITVASHNPSPEEGVVVLRAWHARMYCNLVSHWKENA